VTSEQGDDHIEVVRDGLSYDDVMPAFDSQQLETMFEVKESILIERWMYFYRS
jgi:hypothetical protein